MPESHTEEAKKSLTPSEDNCMKQYQMMVDIYKFHFDIVLKFVAFYYAITGAIVSYWLSKPNEGFMRFALALPIVMGFTLGFFARFGAREVDPLKKDIIRVARHLRLRPFPNRNLLSRLKCMLKVTGWLSLGTAICLLIVSIWRFVYP